MGLYRVKSQRRRKHNYYVIKAEDFNDYLLPHQKRTLESALRRVSRCRVRLGKKPVNHYLVVNVDEPYIQQLLHVMRKYGVHV